MPDVQLNDKGPAVIEVQSLLDRDGALLEIDGDFGHGTLVAVREFQTNASLPVTGVVDAATLQALRALPDASPDIPIKAVAFIGREEVGSRAYYDTHCARPDYPGGASGVTIGVGYDLGYQEKFAQDWVDALLPNQISRLRSCLGLTGTAARSAIDSVSDIIVPWHSAWNVFLKRSVPDHVVLTRQTFGSPPRLPPLCLGVLVSLVYNRGAAMEDSPDHPGNRREMRDIRDAMDRGNFTAVPALLRSMKRLWPAGSDLFERREHEAALFEEGLASVA
jgi:GH24 family phage-related lysozyme (muramidase)